MNLTLANRGAYVIWVENELELKVVIKNWKTWTVVDGDGGARFQVRGQARDKGGRLWVRHLPQVHALHLQLHILGDCHAFDISSNFLKSLTTVLGLEVFWSPTFCLSAFTCRSPSCTWIKEDLEIKRSAQDVSLKVCISCFERWANKSYFDFYWVQAKGIRHHIRSLNLICFLP